MLVFGPLAIGAVLGLALGLLGGGGSILAVPALVYLLGTSPRAAVAASLAIVGLGALSGLLAHVRAGRVAWGTALRFGLSGALGSFAGAWLNRLVSGERLLALLGLLMLLAALLMVRRPRASARTGSPGARPLVFGLGVGL